MTDEPTTASRDHEWAYGDIVFRSATREIACAADGCSPDNAPRSVRVRPAAGVVLRSLMRANGDWLTCDDLQRDLGLSRYKEDPTMVRQDIIIIRRALDEIGSRLQIQSTRRVGYRLIGGDDAGATVAMRFAPHEIDALARIVAATQLSHPRDSRLINEILTRRI